MGALKFQRRVNLRWNFLYRTGSRICYKLPQEFSSEPSLQSLAPLQKRPRSIQLPSPQAR